MSIIVYNKNTGGYLKKHSGSKKNLSRIEFNKAKKRLGIEKSFLPWSKLTEDDQEDLAKIRQEVEKSMFSATPNDARVYNNKNGALLSVGIHVKNENKKTPWDGQPFTHVILPDHLELHEINIEIKILK